MATQNPITLLISLDANKNVSQQNINTYVQSLKKYYDRNPLLISLGINKGNLERELNNVSSLISKKQNELKVNVDSVSATKGMQDLEIQINKVISRLSELNNRIKVANSSGISSNVGNISNASLSNSISQLLALNSSAQLSSSHFANLQRTMNNAGTSLNTLSNNATEATRSTNSLGNAFSQAFTKFPIWMLATTAFYAPLRGIQDLTSRVIELDTALISLQRVSDAPMYQFDQTIEQSLTNVRELSGVATEYLEILNEFARMDNTLDEATELANTAQIFSNISDLNAKESVNALTAATLAFNIAKEDSIQIADKLNEVDNNYSVTTKDLALSLNKAAQSSKTYGVSLDQLVGYTTAISSATRESGNITGNSLKTIFSRIATLPKAQNALDAVGVSVRDASGEMKDVSVVIDELGQKWEGLTKEQQQNTLINVAGTYQQNRLASLMNNYKMATEATTTAIESQGSAMREQEKYNSSLEARLNRLDTAWTDFSKTAGETVIYDSIVVITSALESMTDKGNGLVSVIGLLPPVIVAATVAVYAFNGSFRTLVASTYASTTATVAATGATGLYAGALTGLRTAATLAGVAIKGLLIASGVGVIFAVAGFAIEKLTNVISDNIQKQEEFDTYLEKNSSALTDNRETVEELITKYNELSSTKESSSAWDSTKEEEYLNVQKRLGELYPALIAYTDASGQAHLKTSEEIQKEVDATNRLIEAQNKVTLADAVSEFDKLNESINGAWYDSFSNYIYGSLESQIKQQKNIIKSMEDQGVDSSKTSKQELKLLKLEQQVVNVSDQIKGKMLEIANAVDEVKIEPQVANDMESFLRGLDVSNLDSVQLKEFSTEFGKLQTQLQDAISNEDKALYQETIESINRLAKETKDADFKVFNNDYDDMIKSISNGKNVIIDSEGDLLDLGNEAEEASKSLDGLTESASQLPDALQKQIDKLKDLSSVQEQIVGISEAQVKAISDSITVIEFLGDVSERTEQQELSLANSLQLLSALYPQLTNLLKGTSKQREQAIAIINSENKANQALLKAYELSAQGKMNAEGRATIAHLEETNRRISNINAEIRALDTLQANYNNLINSMSKDKSVMTDADYLRQEKLAQQANNRIALRQADLATLSGTQSTYTTSLSNTNKAIEENDKSTTKSNSSQKDSNKTTKDSIYITDEYKKSLEALNLEIEKQVKLQSTLPEHSDGYKQSLETQIKLEKDKLALIEKQAKSLQSQISSGKIQQTGNVSNTTQVSTTSNGKIHGADGRITSTQTARKNPITGKNETHRGIDIAQATGSRIDAFYKGTVVKAGFHNSYGNVVRVKDENNLEHIYAHLSKISVKVGDIVEAGAKIGEAGSTGDSTGSHLHYEVNSASGKVLDASPYFNPIRNGTKKAGTSTSSSGVTTTDNSQQAIDQAYSDLNALNGEILDQEEIIRNLEKRAIDTSLASYEFKKSNYDKFLENSDNRLNKLTKSSQAYRDELVRSSNALNAKKEINKAEIEQLKSFINSGTLSAKVVEEYTDRLHELGKINSEIDFTLKDLDTSKLESYLELIDEITTKYDKQRNEKDTSIGYDTIVLEELDKSSLKYLKSLEKINSTMKDKQNINLHELNSLNQLITNGKLYGEALDEAKNRVNELNKEIKQLQLDIQEGNFNIIVNVKTQSDAKIDDMQFELDRADAIRKMFEEGSVDYVSYTQKMIVAANQMAEQHLKTRDALVEELKQRDITIERRKEILELLEDEHMAYLNATLAVKDYTKQMKDAVEAQRKDIADNVINALKEAYQEYRDERMKMLDDEIERENEKHNQIMKQLNDEMNLYRKNIEEKLRLIDRQEAERDYNMEIDDMEKERSKIQSQINLLSLDNSNEAKSKRKKLQEQLDKIDKDIAEKRHDRDIELQKQGLNDLLESKEDEINGKIEVQDKEHEAILKGIERQKKYWEKYYSDLLNDERKFAQIREDIMNGHFDKVQTELQQHINDLTATMPQLADTMDGTMQAVGMAIRQNIIDNLSEAMKMINDFNSMQIGSGGFNDGLGSSGGIGSIVGDAGSSNGSGGQSSQSKLVSDADLKVIMAKYMTDVLASQYDSVRANNIREKAHILAKEGRAQGSAIEANSHYNTELAKLSKEDQVRLSNIASSNYNVFESTEMQNAIKRWASSLKSRASALSGGMTSWSGNGIDGKGGKEMIVHPNELINSPLDTKNLLDMSNVMQRAMQFFTPVLKTIASPKSLMSNISNSNSGDTYEITFTGDINNTSKDGANQFATNIMNEIRTKKGGKF